MIWVDIPSDNIYRIMYVNRNGNEKLRNREEDEPRHVWSKSSLSEPNC